MAAPDGRGHLITTDIYAGLILLLVSGTAVLLGLFNLYCIRTMKVFNNSFGYFAASRTIGEVVCNVINVIYMVPVIFIQPTHIPLEVGISVFLVERFFGFSSCILQLVISANRLVAVCFPTNYKCIFTKRLCVAYIALSWLYSLVTVTGYYVMPCSLLAFSPTHYNYFPVGCLPPDEKPVFPYPANSARICLAACLVVFLFDGITFAKVISTQNMPNTKERSRNVRFFFQSILQNIAMLTTMVFVCFLHGNKIMGETATSIVVFDAYYFAHGCNALALIILTPEAKRKLLRMTVSPNKVLSVTPVQSRIAASTILFGVLLVLSVSCAAEEKGNGPGLPQDTHLRGANRHAEEATENNDREIERLESGQAALYIQKKQQIDKALKEIKNMNVESSRPVESKIALARDEVLNEEQHRFSYEIHSNRTKRSTINWGPQRVWSDGVNYFFDPAFSQTGRDFVKMAIRFYEANTCVRFREVDSADPAFPAKIRIYEGPGCFSDIGKADGDVVQDLSLASWCWRFDSSCHELGHALGFIHHHTRSDRDAWIWVNTDNIEEKYKSQYSKWDDAQSNSFGMRYDYGSIMHYWSTLWAKDTSKDVMVAYDSKYQMAIGASQIPTFTDIAILNKLYSCDACAGSTINCARGGYPHPNDCTKCHCPSGFGGNDCSQRASPSPGLNCGQTLTATSNWQVLKQNNVCGNGQHVTANITSPSTCTYHIQAPAGHRIEYWINFIGFDGRSDALCFGQCRFGGLNLKGHDTNWQPEGYRLCCPSQLAERLLTAGNLLVVEAFNNFRYTDFQITYRIDPCGATLTATPHFQWYTSKTSWGTENTKPPTATTRPRARGRSRRPRGRSSSTR